MSVIKKPAVSVIYRVPSKHIKGDFDRHENVYTDCEDVCLALRDVRRNHEDAIIDTIQILREDWKK